MRNSVLTILVRSAVAGAALLVLPWTAYAVQIVDSCTFTCTLNCELNQDITCVSGEGIALVAGVSLDLKGHNIICDDPNTVDGCSTTAITMTGINSTVKDTGPGRGKILGEFFNGVDCFFKSNSRVTGVWIESPDGNGVKNCAQVDNNVFIAAEEESYGTTAAIWSGGVAGTDSIRDNHISGFNHSITVTGNKSVTIEHNVIVMDDQFSTGISVAAATSSALKVLNNTILGPSTGVPIAGNAVATFTQNRCDAQIPGCATCISNGYCAAPELEVCRDPVYYRPQGSGFLNQFTFQQPSTPSVGAYHWMLVDDYPEPNDQQVRTGYFNIVTGGPKSEMYAIGGPAYSFVPESYYNQCTIKSQILVDGGESATSAVNLVVRQNGVQSDGPSITVDRNYLKVYSRLMQNNPITGLPWESDDLINGAVQIGIKNDKSLTGAGVGFADIVLECR